MSVTMSATATAKMFCLGCGSDITAKCTDRRTLDSGSEDASKVIKILKALVDLQDHVPEGVGFNMDVDAVIKGRNKKMPPKMCRKCFLAYKKHSDHQDMLVKNLQHAHKPLEPVSLEPTGISTSHVSKRPRLATSNSPDVVVSINYKHPKDYVLTPKRKSMAKAVVRKSYCSLASLSFSDPDTRKYILKVIRREVAEEVRLMCSSRTNSVLKNQDPKCLETFQWDLLDQEVSQCAPLLRAVLRAATTTRSPRSNTVAVCGMCTAMICMHRNPMMNLVQRINSLILYAGHSSKKVHQRLQKLNVCVSHSSVIRLLDKVGSGFDAKVIKWRDDITATLDSTNEIQTQYAPWMISTEHPSSDSYNGPESDDSDDSWQSSASATYTSESEDEVCTPDSSSPDESVDESSDNDDDSSDTLNPQLSPCCTPNNSSTPITPSSSSSLQPSIGHCTLYHMCGDNIDKVVKSRYIRFGQDKQQSIHYFNSYAVADRVDFTSLSDRIIPTLQTDPKQIALSLLPTPEDDRVLKHNICILMSRILFKHVDFFSL